MGIIHVMDVRESPGNHPCFELGDISVLVCFIVETAIRAYGLTPLQYPVYHREGSRFMCPSNSGCTTRSQPFR